jgi:hypothetical protein
MCSPEHSVWETIVPETGPDSPQARSGLRPRGPGDSGVVARSDVDPVPGDAGQGGSPVMRHDGGYGGGDAPG